MKNYKLIGRDLEIHNGHRGSDFYNIFFDKNAERYKAVSTCGGVTRYYKLGKSFSEIVEKHSMGIAMYMFGAVKPKDFITEWDVFVWDGGYVKEIGIDRASLVEELEEFLGEEYNPNDWVSIETDEIKSELISMRKLHKQTGKDSDKMELIDVNTGEDFIIKKVNKS